MFCAGRYLTQICHDTSFYKFMHADRVRQLVLVGWSVYCKCWKRIAWPTLIVNSGGFDTNSHAVQCYLSLFCLWNLVFKPAACSPQSFTWNGSNLMLCGEVFFVPFILSPSNSIHENVSNSASWQFKGVKKKKKSYCKLVILLSDSIAA